MTPMRQMRILLPEFEKALSIRFFLKKSRILETVHAESYDVMWSQFPENPPLFMPPNGNKMGIVNLKAYTGSGRNMCLTVYRKEAVRGIRPSAGCKVWPEAVWDAAGCWFRELGGTLAEESARLVLLKPEAARINGGMEMKIWKRLPFRPFASWEENRLETDLTMSCPPEETPEGGKGR